MFYLVFLIVFCRHDMVVTSWNKYEDRLLTQEGSDNEPHRQIPVQSARSVNDDLVVNIVVSGNGLL